MDPEFYNFVVERMKEEGGGKYFPLFLAYVRDKPSKLRKVLIKNKLLENQLKDFRSIKGTIKPCDLEDDANFLIRQLRKDYSEQLTTIPKKFHES